MEELREITRWCLTMEMWDYVGTCEDDLERVEIDSIVEYFPTKEKAQKRAKELKEDIEDAMEDEAYHGQYDIEIQEEDGTWVTEEEYEELMG